MARELGPRSIDGLPKKLQKLEQVINRVSRLTENPGQEDWPRELQFRNLSGAPLLHGMVTVGKEVEILNDRLLPALERKRAQLTEEINLAEARQNLDTIRDQVAREILPTEVLGQAEETFRNLQQDLSSKTIFNPLAVPTPQSPATIIEPDSTVRQIETSIDAETPLETQGDQNILTFHVGDKVTTVPKKQLYGTEDIGVAIDSNDIVYVRAKLNQARKNDPTIKAQESGIGKGHKALLLDEANFQKVVAAITPTMRTVRAQAASTKEHSTPSHSKSLTESPMEEHPHSFGDLVTQVAKTANITEHAAEIRIRKALENNPSIKPIKVKIKGRVGKPVLFVTPEARDILFEKATLVKPRRARGLRSYPTTPEAPATEPEKEIDSIPTQNIAIADQGPQTISPAKLHPDPSEDVGQITTPSSNILKTENTVALEDKDFVAHDEAKEIPLVSSDTLDIAFTDPDQKRSLDAIIAAGDKGIPVEDLVKLYTNDGHPQNSATGRVASDIGFLRQAGYVIENITPVDKRLKGKTPVYACHGVQKATTTEQDTLTYSPQTQNKENPVDVGIRNQVITDITRIIVANVRNNNLKSVTTRPQDLLKINIPAGHKLELIAGGSSRQAIDQFFINFLIDKLEALLIANPNSLSVKDKQTQESLVLISNGGINMRPMVHQICQHFLLPVPNKYT